MLQEHNALSWPGLEPRSSTLTDTDHWTTGQSHGIGMPVVQLTTHVKSSTLYSRTVVWSYGHTIVQPNLAWWVTTILYNYGATLCKLCYKLYFFLWMNQKLTKWSSQEIEIDKKHKKKVRHGQGSNYHVTGTSWILIKAWRRLLSQ